MQKFLSPFIICLFLVACGHHPRPKDVEQKNGFYYWSTSYWANEGQTALMDTFNTQVVYLRLFDVGWDQETMQPTPMGNFYSDNQAELYDKFEVIPTIFITNETFKNIEVDQIPGLVSRIYHRVVGHFNSLAGNKVYNGKWYHDQHDPYYQKSADFKQLVVKDSLTKHYFNRVKEIQIDCDWTESTREKYFEFLTQVKKKFGEKIISCTIRLYPYKYPDKAGVPPVDKGMLMCYNVGDVTKEETPNSIFNKKEVMKYLNTKKKYPLTLDYALPIFEWTAIYRNHRLIRIVDKMNNNDLSKKEIFVEGLDEAGVKKWGVLQDIELGDLQLRLKKHDVIKTESIDYNELIYIAKVLSEKNLNPSPHIVLFSFQPQIVRKNEKNIQKIFNSF